MIIVAISQLEGTMVFCSHRFIFAFFPIVFAGYWIIARFVGHRASKVWMIAASLCFYAKGNVAFLPLLVFTTCFNYCIARGLTLKPKGSPAAKFLLGLGIVENLGFLFYFKYTNFFIDNINRFLGTAIQQQNIPLPLGISFYTFLILSCLVDTYKGKSETHSFIDFAMFVTFFPHLIVGPISHHYDMVPQFYAEDFYEINDRNIMQGILLFSIGCAKKVLIAEPLIAHAQNFYNVMGTGTFFQAWGGVIAYTFAYYFDFSGYTDMAQGIALFFNIKLPFNFDSPYKARGFADFWRRWNITISRFFQEHIFSNIFHFGDSLGRLMVATMATFLVSGLWHGAGWHFIFWGAANGILVCISNIMTLKRKKLQPTLAWALTFLMILFTRVLFDSNSMTQALAVYGNMLDLRPLFADANAFWAEGLSYLRSNLSIICLMGVAALISFFAPSTRQICASFEPKWYYALCCGIIFAASLFFMGKVSSFLYFQF